MAYDATYDPIIEFFGYKDLPESLHENARLFRDLAYEIAGTCPNNFERGMALRYLLTSRDNMVRSFRLIENKD